eukprot:c7410_g1_i1.p1 GENE.c7410_g1_i1~~c7410_g1_i1.p1  ORF type:complete len:222 (-),score=42.87 c7410_g1_i1:21-686(-)
MVEAKDIQYAAFEGVLITSIFVSLYRLSGHAAPGNPLLWDRERGFFNLGLFAVAVAAFLGALSHLVKPVAPRKGMKPKSITLPKLHSLAARIVGVVFFPPSLVLAALCHYQLLPVSGVTVIAMIVYGVFATFEALILQGKLKPSQAIFAQAPCIVCVILLSAFLGGLRGFYPIGGVILFAVSSDVGRFAVKQFGSSFPTLNSDDVTHLLMSVGVVLLTCEV